MSVAHVSKLIFDTLEPRLMLNADLIAVDPSQATHDVVIRLVEETSAIRDRDCLAEPRRGGGPRRSVTRARLGAALDDQRAVDPERSVPRHICPQGQ